MLETLREFARERLDEAGETPSTQSATPASTSNGCRRTIRHGARRPEILAWYEDEQDNLRAMLDLLSNTAPIEAARAGSLLHFFWMAQGAFSEEQERLRGFLALDSLPKQSRAALLVRPRPTSRCTSGG